VYAGGNYPRFIESDIPAISDNYGLFTAVQYNINEYIGFKFKLGYNDFGFQGNMHTDAYTQNLSLIYSILPFEDIFPFVSIGGGGIVYSTPKSKGNAVYQFNFGFGSELKLNPIFSLTAELNYNKTNDDGFDGVYDNIYESGSSDDYFSFDMSFKYIFDRGKTAERYKTPKVLISGMNESDYKRYIADSISTARSAEEDVKYKRILDMLENIVQRTVPQQEGQALAQQNTTQRIPDSLGTVAETYSDSATVAQDSMIIESTVIIFAQETQLELSSYLELDKVGQLLLKHPDLTVEVAGFSNALSNENANKKLSEDRASYIKDFLTKMGVEARRLRAVGYGLNEEANKSDNFNSVEFLVTRF
jgi:outer membrane protein OmpA-like peptidoglycan-associated protein